MYAPAYLNVWVCVCECGGVCGCCIRLFRPSQTVVTEFSMKIGASTAVAQERGSKAIDLGWGHNYIWRVVVGLNVCVFV